jgi:DNA adenine methylase
MARSPLIWFGGKGRVANRIIELMSDHKVYVEPFGGAAHVIAQKPPSKNEIYNDIDGNLVNFLMTVREDTQSFIKSVESLPYSRELYEKWKVEPLHELDNFERAVRFFYLNRSGISGGNNENRARTGWRHSVSASQNPARGYHGAIAAIESFAERMKNVMIEKQDFREIITKYDSPDTLFYVDPPYIGREKYYAGGFTEQDHRDLAKLLSGIQGKVIVSYYEDPLLLDIYPNWHRTTFQTMKQAGIRNSVESEELLLMNFSSNQLDIFEFVN